MIVPEKLPTEHGARSYCLLLEGALDEPRTSGKDANEHRLRFISVYIKLC